jgi:hypothetical protein
MLLRDHLNRRGFSVSVGKPEQASRVDSGPKLNLFLYEAVFDPSLRNHMLDADGPAPLWLVLRYLLTAFDEEELSDSSAAHELLGRGMVALHELNYLRVDAVAATSVQLALEHNPEPLKITFEDGTPDLLSKLMQGSDETYRMSGAVQVRPVMLMPSIPPDSSLLVGVDYSSEPPVEIGEEGIGVEVLPTLGASLERVAPASFEPGDTITLSGTDLHLGGLEAVLGDEPLRVTGQWPDRMTVEVESTRPGPGGAGRIASGLGPSAGELPLRVQQLRAGGRIRSSNLVTGRLRPVVETAALAGDDLVLTGQLLGADEDDVIVALFAEGTVVHSFDEATTQPDQHQLTVVDAADDVDAGVYRAIVKVNGVQARNAPQVVFA